MEGGGGEDYALRDSLLVIYTSGVALIGFTIAVWSMLLPAVTIQCTVNHHYINFDLSLIETCVSAKYHATCGVLKHRVQCHIVTCGPFSYKFTH